MILRLNLIVIIKEIIMEEIRYDLIKTLIIKFAEKKISLRSIMIELNAEEFDEFIDEYDEFIMQ